MAKSSRSFLATVLVLSLSLATLVALPALTEQPAYAVGSGACEQTFTNESNVTAELKTVSGSDYCAIQVTAGSTEWTIPTGVTRMKALVVGAGGGGGADAGSGGGGGGVYDGEITLSSSSAASKVNFEVGTGGFPAVHTKVGDDVPFNVYRGTPENGNPSSLSITDSSSQLFQITANGGSGGKFGQASSAATGGSGGESSVSDSSSLISQSGTTGTGGSGGKGVAFNNAGAGTAGSSGPSSSNFSVSFGFLGAYGGGGGGGASTKDGDPAGGGAGGTGGGGAGGGGSVSLSGGTSKDSGRTYVVNTSGTWARVFATTGVTNSGGGGGSGSAHGATDIYTIDGESNRSRNGRSGADGLIGVIYSLTPDAPVSPAATASAGTVSLSWTAPSHTGGITPVYYIEYKSGAGDWTCWNSCGVSSATTRTITGLTDGTTYSFRISATNPTVAPSRSTAEVSATPRKTQTLTWSPGPTFINTDITSSVALSPLAEVLGEVSVTYAMSSTTGTANCTISDSSSPTVSSISGSGTCVVTATSQQGEYEQASSSVTLSVFAGSGSGNACDQNVAGGMGVSAAEDGADCVIAFKSGSGTWEVPPEVESADYLAVGGGGGGGSRGGGGAGAFIEVQDHAVVPGDSISVSVGSGGTKGSGTAAGSNGQASAFDGVQAFGGGGGSSVNEANGSSASVLDATFSSGQGGSGGGGMAVPPGSYTSCSESGVFNSSTGLGRPAGNSGSGDRNAGGSSTGVCYDFGGNDDASFWIGGGGGGAGEAGFDVTWLSDGETATGIRLANGTTGSWSGIGFVPGAGGAGKASSVVSSASLATSLGVGETVGGQVYFSGGGGGGANFDDFAVVGTVASALTGGYSLVGDGGIGGGSSNGAGTANTGGGGSGWRDGTGGSGVVVVRYTRESQAPLTIEPSSSSVTFGSGVTVSATGGSGTGAVSYSVTSGECSIAGTTVTADSGTGTCVITATKAADASYTSATASVTISLSKASQSALSIAVDDNSLAFGETATLSSSGGSGTGEVGFVAQSGDCAVAGTTVQAVGGETDCVITAVKRGDDDYLQVTATNTVTISISKAAQTITFGSVSTKTYGASAFDLSPSASSGLTVELSSTTTGICTVSGLTVSLVGAGTCTLVANQEGNSSYSAASGVTQSFTVSAKAITVSVTVADKVYDSSTAATISSGELSGVVGTDVVTFVAANAEAAFSSETVGEARSVTVTLDGDELAGADAGNYSLTVSGAPTGNITAKPVTVSVVPAGKTYDGTQSATVLSASVTGVESGDTVSVETSKIVVNFDAPGAGTQNASATLLSGVLSGAEAANYSASVGSVSSAVIAKANQASLSFTSAASMVFGQTIPLVATGGSGSGALSYTRMAGPCTVSGATVEATGAGDCVVKANRAADDNYNEKASPNFKITVAKASQSINFTSSVPVSAVAGTTYTPAATATSGLSVSFDIAAPGKDSVCSIASGVVTFLTSGTCVIEADQAGNSNYNAATRVTQTIVAGKINQTITFPSISAKDFDDAAFLAGATVSSGRTVTFATSTGSVCAVNASTGLISIKTIGDCTVTASSSGDSSYAAASDVSRTFTISPVVAGKPSVTSVSFGNSSVTVAFGAPGANGGDSIDGYQVVATSSGGSVTKPDCSTTSPCTISGLTNGESYTLTVAAINAAGVGPASDASPAVTPATIPDAVSALTTTPGDEQLEVNWSKATSFGGGDFTGYELSLRVRGENWGTPVSINTVATETYTFTGLTNGTAYDVKIVTISTANGSELSSNTATALGVPATAPDAPTGLTLASLSNTSAVASWTAPDDDGGSAITAYSVNLSCTFANSTDTFCTLTGLTAGSRVTVTVGATNLMGTGTTVSAVITMPGASSGGSSGSSSRSTAKDTPVVTPRVVTPTLPGARVLPRPPVRTPRILNAPVTTPADPTTVNDPARVLVGGRPVPTLTEARGASEVNVRAGKIDLGLGATTPSPSSTVRTNPSTNAPELTVDRGESTSLNVRGLLPGSTLQVWLPGAEGRELARVPVNPDGSVTEEISFTASRTETPLPLGRQVLQVTGFDEDGNQTVVDMTINIAQGAPSPEPNRLTNELPDLQPGQSLATSAGVPETVTISANAETREVSVSSNEWSFRVVVPEANGTVDAEDPSAPTIRLIQARTAEVNGDGFQPDTRVDIFLFSDPTLLGSFNVNADGTFEAEVFLEARFAVVGDHTLQIQGVGTDGYIKAANLGVLVEEPVALTTETASNMLWWVVAAFIALALLVLFFLVARRLRRDA